MFLLASGGVGLVLTGSGEVHWLFLLMPLFLLGVIRSGFVGGGLGILAAMAGAVLALARASGDPTLAGSLRHDIPHVQGFILTSLVVCLAMATVLAQRDRAQSELRRTHALLDQVLENLPAMLFLKDARDLRFVRLNRAAEEITGFRREDMLGRGDHDFFPPEQAEFFTSKDRAVLESGTLLDIPEEVIHNASGDARLLHTCKVPIWDDEGRPAYLLGIAQDITKRRRTEEALRESEARHRSLFESTLAVMFVLDPADGRILDANPAAEAFYGWSRQELMAMSVYDLNTMPEEALRAELARAIAGRKQTYEFRHRRADGTIRDVEVFSSPIAMGGKTRLFSIIHDITDRKRAERESQASEERFTKAFHLAPVLASLSQFADGTILDVNEQYCRVLGHSRGDLVGRSSIEACIMRTEDRARLKDLFGSGSRLAGVDFVLYTREAREVPCLYFGEIFQVGEERILLSMLVDMTGRRAAEEERKILEQQLHHAQKLESLGLLAGGVAHDMNNVLAAILSLASVQRERAQGDDLLARNMDTIVCACERGGTLVKGLLGFARKSVAEFRHVDLNRLVREETALLERTTLQRVELEMALAEALPPVLGDPAALSHVLMNLCVNAVDAMPEGGRLAIRTSVAEDGQVRLEVQDSGCGMTKDILDKALDPFYTTKPQGKGTGLGLSVAYGTITSHRGHLELRSKPGRGTTVTILLPPAPSGEVTSLEREPAKAIGPLHILLVDDDELVQGSTRQLLEALEHHVTAVSSGEGAIECLEGGLPCDAVILDLNMPGMGGAAALKRIRALHEELPVLLATGRADQDALDLVAEVPRVRLMAKPFSLADLREGLATLA